MQKDCKRREYAKKKKRIRRIVKRLLVFVIVFLMVVFIGGSVMLQSVQKKDRGKQQGEKKCENIAGMDEKEKEAEAAYEEVGDENAFEMKESVAPVSNNQIDTQSVERISDNGLNSQNEQTNSYADKQFYITPKYSGEVELVFGGDICFYDDFRLMAAYRQREGDITKCISEDLLAQMQEADIFILNNEFAYSDRGQPLLEKAFTFRSKPENVRILRDMGVDIVGLANNHVWDYGEDAMLDTLSILEEEGIPYIGAGRNLDEARMPAYFNCGDFTIAYVNATQIERNESPDTKGATADSPGTFRCFSETEFANLLDTIIEAKQNADFVVVYIHWGTENTTELDWAQTYQAPLIAESGADLIVGNHTHCLQGIDYIGETPVIYSIGNFWFNSKELDTCIVKAVVNKEGLKSFQFVPAKQQNCTTSLLYEAEKTRVLDFMRNLSPNVLIDENGFVGRK